MTPIWTIFRWQLRKGWRALVVFALVVAIATGFVMTAAAGARRTGSAWTRLRQATKAADAEAWVYDDADQLEATLRGLPDVVATGQYAWMFVYPLVDMPLPAEGMYVQLSDSVGRDINAPLIVAGRAADPSRADELTINEAMADLTGLGPGDGVDLRSAPEAVEQHATIVGIHRGARDLNEDAGLMSGLLTPAFGRRWFAPYRNAFIAQTPGGYPTVVGARFRVGTDLAQVTADLRQQFGDNAPQRVDDDTTALRDALSAQSTAYTLFAVIGGLAAVAALGQAMSRRVKRSSTELAVLSVFGLCRWQRVASVLGAPLTALSAGALTAPGVAYATSATVPRGLARRVDPSSGLHVDGPVAAIGAVGVVAVLAIVGVATASRATLRHEAERITSRHNAASSDPARLFGLRVARGWATRSNRSASRSQALTIAGAVALIAAVATWSAASHHVDAAPRLWGTTWQATVAFDEERAQSEFQTADALWLKMSRVGDELAERNDIVKAIAAVQVGTITFDGLQLETATIEDRAGSEWPPVIHGREARGPDEFDAGSGIIGRAGWSIGDDVRVGGTTLRLVGEVVAPNYGTGEFGQTIVMSPAALERVGGYDLRNSSYLFVDLARGATPEQLLSAVGDAFTLIDPIQPSPVLGVHAIGGVDELLLGFIAMIGIVALVHGIRSATWQRRRDHAVLRALGARSRFIARATGWHTAYTIGLAAVIGVPLGWLVGRIVWKRTATDMGVVVGYPSPLPMLGMIVGGTLAVGAAASLVLGTLAAGRSSTRLLRDE